MNYIKIENINKTFSRKLYNDLHFNFEENKPCAVTGPNGSGKSTLINIMSLKFLPESGIIKYFFNGLELNEKQSTSMTGIVSPYFNPYNEMDMIQIAEFISCGNSEKFESINENYKIFHIDKKEKFGNLSEGYKQRVKISLAFICDIHFFLLDEPFTALDTVGRKILNRVIAKNNNSVLVIASNDENEIKFCREELNLG